MRYVDKPWGSEEWLELNDKYCFKILRIKAGKRISLQYHTKKIETMFFGGGSGILLIGNDKNNMRKISVKKGGIITIKPGQIHRLIARTDLTVYEASSPEVEDVVRIEDDTRRVSSGKTVVAVSGYFDPLHVGHLEMMELAKKLGDHLVVIINNDKQAVLKKGGANMCEDDRIKLVKALKVVDEVVLSIDEDLAQCKTLAMVKPDIFAQGGDRHFGEVPETPICKELGIKMVDGLGKKIRSSSEIIKRNL